MYRSVAKIVFAAALTAAALTIGARADGENSRSADSQVLFQPTPITGSLTGFETKVSSKSLWLPTLPETKFAWLGNYSGDVPATSFSSRDPAPDALAKPLNEFAVGNNLLRFDTGRNYDDVASAVTDFAQSPDAPNFRPLFKAKHKRSAFSLPYLGLSFTTPTNATAR